MGRLISSIKSILLGLAVFFCSVLVQAQQVDRSTLMSSFPKEQLSLVANAEVILSGQMLAYSINCHTNGSQANISDIAYVELVSDTKTSIFKHKLRLNNGKAYGDYFLSTALKTGHYKLIAYTTWSLNNAEDAFYQTDIYIINPYLNAFENNLKNEFNENEGYTELSINHELNYKGENEDNRLKISTDSDSYKKRSKVSLNLKNVLDASNYSNYSVLVKRIDSINIQNHHINKSSNTKSSSSAYYPEMRGELVQGIVVDSKSNLPVVDQPVSLSINGEHHLYKSTKTNAKGVFYFNVFEPHEKEKALIQVVSENRNDFKLIIKQKEFDKFDELKFYPLKLDKNLEYYISQNSIFNQVESAYYNLKQDSLILQAPITSFYGKPDMVYVLDDFTRFPSVKETFIEVVQEAAIRTVKDGYQFLVYDYNDPFAGVFKTIKPLLIFDGIQIQDENIVVGYNPEAIESVSLVKGVYSLGSVVYNGIIDIKLKKETDLYLSGTFMQHLDIHKPIVQKEYFKQDYSTEQNRIPDFRTQLLWEPDFVLNTNSKTIDFYTSDVTGYYLIEVNSYTFDGQLNKQYKIFKVTDD